MSDLIRYLRGIFQGDSLSVLLFILAVNPLSFLLNKLKGYKMGSSSNRNTNITHLFFVEDRKLYDSNLQEATKLLDLVTTFSNDVKMKFRESKCAYLKIEKSLIKQSAQNLEINNAFIKPIKEGESYKYIGQDENLGYVASLNKERVTNEYKKRVYRSVYNKHLAHKPFSLPVLTPTFGILNWNICETENLDITTRKILNMTGNFNRNSDIDRSYLPHRKGG